MYCPNCGNDMKEDKFCTKCGYSKDNPVILPQTPVSQTSQNQPKRSSKGGVAVVIIIAVLFVLGIIGAIVAVFAFTFKTVLNFSTQEFFELNDIKIPSVYKVTGTEHKICGTNFSMNGNEGEMSILFCDELDEDEKKEYVDYLMDEEGYSLFEGSDEYNLKKESEEYTVYIAIRRDAIKFSYSKERIENDRDSFGV